MSTTLPELAELLDGAPVAVLAINLNGEILVHNAGLRAWMRQAGGGEVPSLAGRNLLDWLSPASRMLYETRVMPRVLATGGVREVIFEVRDPSAQRRSVMVNADLHTLSCGRKVVVIAVMTAADRVAFERELLNARSEAELAHQRLVVLQEATGRIALAQGVNDLAGALVAAAARVTQAAWVAVRIRREGVADARAGLSLWGACPPGEALPAEIDDAGEQVLCVGLGEIRARYPAQAAALAGAGVEAMVVTPVTRAVDGGNRVLGELICWFRRNRSLEAAELETLVALAAQAELVIDHLALQERLRHRALHDELTGLPNRVLLEEELARALATAARTGQGCAVLFLDLDGFKAINDGRGHAVGDEVLQAVATRLLDSARGGEIVSRLGGDEFVVVVNGVDRAGAAAAAQRLWLAIRVPLQGAAAGCPLSSSVGALFWDPAAVPATPEVRQFIAAADGAMYAAKHGGKDTINVCDWAG